MFLSLSLCATVFPAMGGEVQATPLSDLPASPPSASSSEATPTKSSPKKNRCFVCRKKVGLTGKPFCVVMCTCVCVERWDILAKNDGMTVIDVLSY